MITRRWPPGCDAYIPLNGVTPPEIVYIPASWCARTLRRGERIRVGDQQGRRAEAAYLGDRLSQHLDLPIITCGFRIERLWLPGHEAWLN